MKPAPFEYHAPASVEEALDLLCEHGWAAKLLAGGQSLVPAMNFRLAQPSVLIDLNRIEDLSYIRGGPSDGREGRATSRPPAQNGELLIGAMTRQRTLETDAHVATQAPLVRAAMPHIAHPQIRNRGTVGGSLAHADPAAELPAVMIALGGRFKVRNREAERWVSATDFFQGLFETALEPEELLVEIAVPSMPPRSGWAFQEIARRHGDYALVGVAAVVALDEGDTCAGARIVFLSVGTVPVEASEAATLLEGETVSDAAIAEASRVAAYSDIEPRSDIHASAEYRRHLAEVLCRRALRGAFARARAGRSSGS